MEQHILGLSGVKQSGKTTTANFIHGYQMRYNEVIEKFLMDEEGNLIVNTFTTDDDGERVDGVGVLDINRRDIEFIEFASQMIWPYVRSFSFAEPLKSIAIQLFGLTEAQCFGTEEEKNTPINIKWEDVPTGGASYSEGFMTAREFLQYFGTDVCRKIKDDVWVSLCINQIKLSGTQLAIIPDCRFKNEAEAIKEAGGKVIRFTRRPHEDSHASETDLDNYDKFDAVIDNANRNIDETNMKVMEVLREWGWLEKKA
ncbi:hypothetical protein CL634_07755 [bacterium]|nr:hypothetical protein [bacterium]|tara:strand:+ start:289 stop:1056 length:768 start_codon:yes stop_codon:yes gene_type:complete